MPNIARPPFILVGTMANLDENRFLAYPPNPSRTPVNSRYMVSNCVYMFKRNKGQQDHRRAHHHWIDLAFPRWQVLYFRPVVPHSSEDYLELTLPAFNKGSSRRGITLI